MRLTDIKQTDNDAAVPAETNEAWSKSYKKSINCNNPKGFSQRAHCAGRRKRQHGGKTKSKSVSEANQLLEAKRKRAKTIIDGMIKTLMSRGRTKDEAIADLKKQIDSRFYEHAQMLGRMLVTEADKLTRKDPVERWIARFKSSAHPKFAGKSMEQREKMARAAHYRAVQNYNPYATSKPKSEVQEDGDAANYEAKLAELLRNVADSFRHGHPYDALEQMEESDITVNDTPVLKALFDANARQIAKMVIDDLRRGDADGHMLERIRDMIETVGVRMPHPGIADALYDSLHLINTYLRKVIYNGGLDDTIGVADELNNWGISIDLEDMIDIEDEKDNIIRIMLVALKKNDIRKVEMILNAMRHHGYEWPELDDIEQSIEADKPSQSRTNNG